MRVALILCMLLVALPVWAGTFKDDFNDGNDNGWDRWLNGKWEFADGQYVITVVDDCARSAWGKLKWSDYTVEARIRATKRLGYPAIDVRAQDQFNRYIWALDVANNDLIWYRQINGNYTRMTVDPAPGDPLEAHVFKAVVSGNQFEGYYDGKLIRKWNDANGTFKTGRVGVSICVDGAQAAFDDFIVTGDGVPDSGHAVTPQRKLAITWARIRDDISYE